MQKSILNYLRTGAIALGFALASTALGQGLTSSTISGVVTDSSGKAVGGATVTVFYAPTNSTSKTTTTSSGTYSFPGLRVGGPYTVSASANGMKPKEVSGVQLDLSQVFQANFSLEGTSEVVKMEAFVTTTDANSLFDSLNTGSGSQISQQRITTMPTIARTINEYARLDPRVVITDKTNGETSAAGQNGRYNSIQIDGVRSNDVFGLTSNGLPAQGNPISIDTIDAIDVEVSPYDVRQSGFTGASINAVTKSGTNEYHGAFKYLWTNQNLRQKNLDVTSALYGKREQFKEQTFSSTLGGPIIKDKLFFFLGYETFKHTELTPTAGFTPDPTALALVIATLKSYGYDPGTLTGPGNLEKSDKKSLAKIDWNISSQQRLSVRYNKSDGHQPIFQDYSSTAATSFSNHWYTNAQIDTSYVASLFSNWTPDFTTETKVSYSEYKADRAPSGALFPQIVIGAIPNAIAGGATGSLFVGTENSTQINHLKVKDKNLTFNGNYLWGDHTFTAGTDIEKSHFYNAFLQSAFGAYGTSTSANGFTFAQLGGAAGFTGITNNYSYSYPPIAGGDIAANWGFTNPAFFVQDSWRVNSQLTLVGGVRLDYFQSDKPKYNDSITQAFGVRNDNSLDGLNIIAPRFGFNWTVDSDRKTLVRGGIGVFEGKSPGVWLSNNYTNNAITTAQATKATLTAAGVTNLVFQPDITKQYTGGTNTYAVNMMDNNFKLPSVLKGNIAVVRKLPWAGMTGTLEWSDTKTLENFWYQDLNLKPDYLTPDGRQHYTGRINAGFTNAFLMKNTKKGDAQQTTLQIEKPYKNRWYASIAYTYGHSTDVSPVTSSTAGSNFGARMAYNSNSEELSRSNYDVKHRVISTLSREFSVFKNFPTTVGFTYEARSGRPFSYVFSNDANGDTANQSNDLFYVPSGPNDPKVHFATQAQSDAFFSWLAGNGDLNKYAGKVVPRNSGTSRFLHQLDFHLEQQIPIWGNVKGSLFYDITNLGNLINSKWGRFNQIGFAYNEFVASATSNSTDSFYTYTYTTTPRLQALQSDISRWQMQLGVQVKF